MSGSCVPVRPLIHAVAGVVIGLSTLATAAPIAESWTTETNARYDAVAAAELSGWYATSETNTDTIEIRDVRQSLMHRITRNEIQQLAPWMTLDSSEDGPRALAWTDSGRSLFIVVTDDAPSDDGLGSDVILRYDTTTKQLTRFARATLGDATGPGPSALHYHGKLWVSTETGPVRVYFADRNETAGFLHYTWSTPTNEPIVGMTIARSLDLAFVLSESMLYRVDLTQPFALAEPVGPVTRGRSVAYTDHLGAAWQEGVYLIEGAGSGDDARIMSVPKFQATGLLPYVPSQYLSSSDDLTDLSATACGRFLVSDTNGARVIRDSEDYRLDYESWVNDEFNQVLTFANGLVSPDGEPAGWVIDADVAEGNNRFHPPSPDGAAWVVMMHIAKDHLANSQESTDTVRNILKRYAGLMGDGIAPQLTSDGIMRHWYDPFTGNGRAGWSQEYATLSTMLIVMAADRALRFYDDQEIMEAAAKIIDQVAGWDSYIQPGSEALYLRALASGGPDFGTAGGPFYEGVLFVEQASVFGSSTNELDYWLDRSSLPSSEFVDGLQTTSNWPGNHLPAFVSLYPLIAQEPFRDDPDWEAHIRNSLAAHSAWTDDNAPRYMTVFSAGTTRSDWGGYHADSLSDHQGDISTFPSLMAFSSLGETAPSVGAYHAYRHGARQDFESGASILFRRSEVDPSYTPSDAGLSDVVIGALGLAELIKPGTTDAVFAVSYQPPCAADLSGPDGLLDFFDISAFLSAYVAQDSAADMARPFGQYDFFDISAFLGAYSAGCP